ncbi:MAG TPA: AI-2E family transporter [Pseudolabrys sp.]|nr:AI-2E family transporter [Pseudolabrys sp.]
MTVYAAATIPPMRRYWAMDARNPKAGGGPRLDKRVPGRRRLPLDIENPVPLTALPQAWRNAAQAATVGIFVVLFFAALSLAKPIVLPTVAAFVVTMMLSPLSERADDYRIPPVLTALVLWLAVVAVFYAVITLVSSPVVEWVNRAPDIGRSIQQKLELLDRPLNALRDMRNAILPAQAGKGINVDVMGLVQQAVALVTPAVSEILIFFVSLFFMLLGRRRLRHVFVGFFHRREGRLRTLRIMSDVEHNLTGYLSVVAVINAAVGIGAGIIAAVVGLPDPVAWGVLGFVMNFIPYIGAGIMELGMFLVGLVTFPTLTHAIIAPLLYLGMGLLEGQFVTPSIVGHRFTLNPLTVFLSLVFWAWLWGPVGAFLAVPLLIIGWVVFAHLFPKHEPDLPA